MQPSQHTFIASLLQSFYTLYQFKQEDLLWNEQVKQQ